MIFLQHLLKNHSTCNYELMYMGRERKNTSNILTDSNALTHSP